MRRNQVIILTDIQGELQLKLLKQKKRIRKPRPLGYNLKPTDKPMSDKQLRALSAVNDCPGQTLKYYTLAIYGYNLRFVRDSIKGAIDGLIRRGLVRFYAACHCGAELTKLKNRRRCSACGSLYAECYVKEDRIKLC